ncbi:disease resistance response protein [Trifolium pratense]|uniref:Dirigent protein n=1 Tax=Trifolium pratense TaxID=57577 RepID=A0A2K3P015_TRIPR|nr:disease resistance response protein [Trifolium pratense]
MFGSVTVIDDQLTEGHELGSSVVGRVQGFYTASSLELGWTASPKSEVAVIGGTGKYENARGYAALETLLKEDQHTTDGVDTILHFNLYHTH